MMLLALKDCVVHANEPIGTQTVYLPRYKRRKFSLFRCRAIPPVCFTQECQTIADQYSLFAIGVPVLAVIAWIGYLLRPIPKDLLEKEEIFIDPDTGLVFQGEDGTVPARDKKGDLIFKAIGFTPWPVAMDDPGERIQIEVGKVGRTEARTFVFSKLTRTSQLIRLELPRPLGLVFAEDVKQKRVVVDQILPNTAADQKHKLGRLKGSFDDSPMVGDILRAITTVNFVYPTNALLGMNLPERHLVVFGADGQSWAKCRSAFKGEIADGMVTVILERQIL